MLERKAKRDCRSRNGTDDGRACPSEERLNRGVGPNLVESWSTEEDEEERWGERDKGSEKSAHDSGSGVADDSDGLDDRAGSDLAERNGIEELGGSHPVVRGHGVVLHQGDDDKPAPIGESADLER